MRRLFVTLAGAPSARLRRAVLAVALSIATTAGGLLLTSSAHAQTVVSGSFAMTSDPGDYIGQGLS
jgi:hypothetical protein